MTAVILNPVKQILNDKATYGFLPNQSFYEAVKVKRKRWGMLVRGEKDPTIIELKAICQYFNVNISDYIN